MNLHPVDIAVLVIYMASMVGMGFYFLKKNKNTEEYFLGGRRFSGWAIGLSMMGTAISSITFLGMPADAFKTTWIRYITYFGLPIAIIFAVAAPIPLLAPKISACLPLSAVFANGNSSLSKSMLARQCHMTYYYSSQPI